MDHPLRESTDTDPAVSISSWKIKPGHEQDLERVAHEVIDAAAQTEGHISGTVLHEPGSPRFHIVHRFESEQALSTWLTSPARKAVHPDLNEIAEREGKIQRVTGLEGWFLDSRSQRRTMKPPPRWKMWLASLAGAYPLVLLFQWLIAPHLADLPLPVRAAVFPLIILTLMTYAMMPFVTRLLHGWLFAENRQDTPRSGDTVEP
ncbi:MAG: antibiotic biosynthesis monooxygenase [Baekduiaceae bacterium]